MIRKDTSSTDILKDIEEVYMAAMEKGNFSVALKAKELLGRERGLFSMSKKKTFALIDLSEEDLNRLLQEIEMQLKCNK
jgi:hypothetical protein